MGRGLRGGSSWPYLKELKLHKNSRYRSEVIIEVKVRFNKRKQNEMIRFFVCLNTMFVMEMGGG